MHWDGRERAGVASAALAIVRNQFRYKVLGRKDLVPLYVVWHVTLRCNLACAFCDDGTGRKYPDVRHPELGTEDACRLLALIRKACRAIYITGGEPFVRKDSPKLLRYAHRLGFWPTRIYGSLSGLETLLRVRPFICHPTLAPQLYPNGDLFYPCKPLWRVAGNVQQTGSFRKTWRAGQAWGLMPACGNRCHMTCYVNDSQWMENPLEIIRENCRMSHEQPAPGEPPCQK